jgi:membrane fusion protein (multidrug efflux system)
LEGVINVIEPVLDPGTRSARVVARAKNPEGKFRPGMSANITTVLAQRENALTVPSEAVVVEGNQAFVYVVNPDSTVVRTPLTLGTRMPDAVEVVDGVSDGTVVVRAGHQKLYPGAKVMPVQSVAATSGGAPAAKGAAPDSATAEGARP